uniref:Uncharacterized protein n=1 Tax=Acrobeloides nanus TaxID=290746 RepID=A0A914DXR6_9BILA
MMCLYWCIAGPEYWELLESGETFNSDVYCRHMDNVQAVLDQMETDGEWEGPINLLQDNAKPIGHEDRPTCQGNARLGSARPSPV